MQFGKDPREWDAEITDFTVRRQKLPHMELPGSWYFLRSRTAKGIELTSAQRDVLMQTLRLHDGVKYVLDAAVIMPDHLHLLLQPMQKKTGYYSLSEIFHSIKGFVAHTGGGPLWQDDNYDHIIRNERDHAEKLVYLINNPVEAELVERYADYRWLYVKGLVDWRVELPVIRRRR